MPPTIKFVPFTQYEPATLAPRLVTLVAGIAERLRVDFPALPRRYGNLSKALSAVTGNSTAMRAGSGFGAFAIELDGDVFGVASYTMYYEATPVVGPLIAGWMGVRTGDAAGIGLELLRAGATALDGISGLHGYPWTLARPLHPQSPKILTDLTNGFDGFRLEGEPGDYSRLDGVQASRQLYVANRAISALRS